jgi:O-acetyl-ADP-ribose deacetylase (regulator of RNase III)
MGSGIARQIREQFPHAYEADKTTVSGDRSKLGTYTVALGKRFNIINAYTQYGFNRGGTNNDMFEYEAFQNILDTLVKEYPGCRFGFPMIGCGLAGGDASRIIPMLENFAEKIESTGGTATLIEFA